MLLICGTSMILINGDKIKTNVNIDRLRAFLTKKTTGKKRICQTLLCHFSDAKMLHATIAQKGVN